MADILGDLKDQFKDTVEDKLDDLKNPNKLQSTFKKKRGAFWTCFLAALLLVLLSAIGATAWNATKVSLFQQGIKQNVDLATLGVSESSADDFAVKTIAYLQGTVSTWEPVIVVGDHVMPIPQAFTDHMATVKSAVASAKTLVLAFAAIALLLLGRAVFGGRRFSLGGYYLGAAIPLALLVGVGCWAYFGFDSFWNWLHATFIPDGIFDASAEIMKLFPTGLFLSYLAPVAKLFAICVAVVLLLPLLLAPIGNAIAKSKNKQARRSSSRARRTTSRKSSSRKTTSAKRKSATAKSSAN